MFLSATLCIVIHVNSEIAFFAKKTKKKQKRTGRYSIVDVGSSRVGGTITFRFFHVEFSAANPLKFLTRVSTLSG